MRGSIKIIKFTAFMSILLFILTYFITINIEAHIFELNTIWISNNLTLTVFGGALASMLVVLLCEVQKYITTKASVEEYIFYHALYLYIELFLMQQNIYDYLNNTEAIVPDNLLDEPLQKIQSEIFTLQSTDYAPFKQNNSLLTAHQKFCRETAINFQPILNGKTEVKIAINEIKIRYLHQNILNKSATVADEPLKSVLSAQFDRVSDALKKVDDYLKNIDKYCKQRYDWENYKKHIHSNYVNIFETCNLKKELKKEI